MEDTPDDQLTISDVIENEVVGVTANGQHAQTVKTHATEGPSDAGVRHHGEKFIGLLNGLYYANGDFWPGFVSQMVGDFEEIIKRGWRLPDLKRHDFWFEAGLLIRS